MQQLADKGEAAYRKLTEQTPGFLDYFYEATPVSEIGMLNIGSRPSHRAKGDRSKSSVRAIAWVFGWAQARQTLPAWYGLGSALEDCCKGDRKRLKILRQMYRDWPFFRALLSNTQMALFKSRMDIAREYAELCSDEKNGREVFGMIEAEYLRTVKWIRKVAQIDELLDENPLLKTSLSRRDAYLDPLNHIQLDTARTLPQPGDPRTRSRGQPGSRCCDRSMRSPVACATPDSRPECAAHIPGRDWDQRATSILSIRRALPRYAAPRTTSSGFAGAPAPAGRQPGGWRHSRSESRFRRARAQPAPAVRRSHRCRRAVFPPTR